MNDGPLEAARNAWQAGDLDQAETLVGQLLAAAPDYADALMLAANVAFARDDMRAAQPILERLAGLLPSDVGIQTNLGHCRLSLDDPQSAERAFRDALQIATDDARALDGLGVALHRQGHYRNAEASHRRATVADPGMAAAWCNLGIALTDLGDYDDADKAFEKALALEPHDAKSRFNHSIIHLMRGDYATGWPLYEARLALRGDNPPPGQRWRGEALQDQPLLLFAEQGFGDFIQFARYVPIVAEQVGSVLLAVPPPLLSLIQAQGWNATCIPQGQATPAPHWCPLMSVLGTLGLTPASTPGNAYLAADPSATAKWRARRGNGLNVGLAWAGNPTHRRDRDRSLGPDQLRPLFDGPEISWRSLQVGVDQGRNHPLRDAPGFVDFAADFGDFADTAAALTSLDLVISVDTAVLHLAGALGVPTWGMLPFVPDWRWGATGAKTPWYDSLRLFRQPAMGDWASVIAALRSELQTLKST